MPQRILGIDVGSWSVKAVLLESSFRGFKVESVHEVPLAPGAPDSRAERQTEALQELLAIGAMKADSTVACIPGEQVTLRFIDLPFSDPRKVEVTMTGELADVLPFDIDDAVHDHAIVDKREDGSSLSLAAAALKTGAQSTLDTLRGADLDPRYLAVDVLQLYNLYAHFLAEDASRAETPTQASPDASTFVIPAPGGPPDGRLIVDVGHERTLVCACGEKGVAYARVIRTGGRDVTEAIAESYQLEWSDAEAGKHEDAFVASSRHPAPSDGAQKMSDVVAGGLKILIQELRRSIQAIRREKRIRVARIDLLGGGSRIRNLAPYLAEQLNVPVAQGAAVEQVVERYIDTARRPAHTCALALALRANSDQPVSRIDLRRGELSFAGQLQNLRHRIPALMTAAAVISLLVIFNTVVHYQLVSTREAEVDEQFCAITEEVVGRRICEPAIALSVLREPASELGSFKLPEKSAFRVAAELSHLSPKELDVRLTEMDIRPDRARVVGVAANFDAVDQIVSAYDAEKCIDNIKKGNLRKQSDGQGVEFPLAMDLRCSR